MMKRRLWRLAVAVVACATLAVNASAQITTGTVSGTVKDPQGGVVPGATVTLTSETKGTKLAPVVTGTSGDYVIPNITPDTYTVEVTMDGFKTLRRQGVQVSGGDRVALGDPDHRSRRRVRNGERHGRSGARPVAEWRAFLRHHDDAGRQPAREPRQLHEPHVADARRRAERRVGRRHPPRRRRPEQHHDGRCLRDGHRQQRPDARDEPRVHWRGEDPHPGLSGRIRALERPADHGRHQVRAPTSSAGPPTTC